MASDTCAHMITHLTLDSAALHEDMDIIAMIWHK